MPKVRLTAKVLIAIAVTLSIGFACLGVLSLYLSYTSMLDLQRTAARQAASNVMHDLIELKMKGDFQAFNKYVDDQFNRLKHNVDIFTSRVEPVMPSTSFKAPSLTWTLRKTSTRKRTWMSSRRLTPSSTSFGASTTFTSSARSGRAALLDAGLLQ